MADIKWIKITTSMFDDEKIRLIDAMPERDTIFYIWIRLLVQAGKTNAGGYIFLTENVPYSEEMLSTIFNRQLSSIRFALRTLMDLEMVERTENNFIKISNWEKHQNIIGMDKVKEQNRLRKQKQREKEKLLIGAARDEISVSSEFCHVMSRDSHAIEIDREIDKEEDIEESSMLDNRKNLNQIEQAYFNTFYRQISSNYLQAVMDILNKGDYTSLVIHAIELTKLRSEQQKKEKGFKYTLSIIESWVNKGYKTVDDVLKHEGKSQTGSDSPVTSSQAYKPFDFSDMEA